MGNGFIRKGPHTFTRSSSIMSDIDRSEYPDEPISLFDILERTRLDKRDLQKQVEELENQVIEAKRNEMKYRRLYEAMSVDTPEAGCVYIIKSPTGEYKIGKTKRLTTRIQQLQTGLPYKIEHVLSLVTPSMAKLERELHDAFADRRVGGEWFNLGDDDIQQVKRYYADLLVSFDD